MSLLLSEEQQILKQAARDFVRKEFPLVRIRELRDTNDSVGDALYHRERFARLNGF